MIYRGYRIIPRKHPTPMNPERKGYDVESPEGLCIKANFAELSHCRQTIDNMIRLGKWPKY